MLFTTTKQSFSLPKSTKETLGLSEAPLVLKDNSIPKAYINYLFFDKENNFKSGGYRQVSEAALGSSRSEFGTGFEELSLDFSHQKAGIGCTKYNWRTGLGDIKTVIMKYHPLG
jgi:hypothetical protein